MPVTYSDPSIAMGVKPQNTMTSLAEMIGIARGAQELQQRQVMNPLLQQAAELEVERQRGVLEPTISKAKSEAEVAGLQSQTARQAGIFNRFGSAINNPLIVNAEKNPQGANPEKLAATMMEWGKQQGKELGLPEDVTTKLTQPYVDMALNNPGQLRSYLIERHIMGLAGPEKAALLYPRQTEINGKPALANPITGAVVPPEMPGPETPSPASAPASGTTSTGGVTTSPVQPPAPAKPSPLPMNVPPDVAKASQPVPPVYPVRDPSKQLYTPLPTEEADRVAGFNYRNGLTEAAQNVPQIKRNIDEATAQIAKVAGPDWQTAGAFGRTKQYLMNIAGQPEYKQLSKDLANLEIAQLKVNGGSMDTVSGQKLQRLASGDETYPPEVLANIVGRAGADLKNLDMQTTAAQKYFAKYGDSNMKSFQTMWRENAKDTKVFQALNIRDSDLSKEQKERQLNDLIGKDPKQRAITLQRMKNILKLTNDGTL